MLPRFIDSALLRVRVESAKSLIVDQNHLILVSGEPVLQKTTYSNFELLLGNVLLSNALVYSCLAKIAEVVPNEYLSKLWGKVDLFH